MRMQLRKERRGDGRLTALVLSGALVAVAPSSFAQIPPTAPGGGQPVSTLPPPAYPEWTVQRAIRTRSGVDLGVGGMLAGGAVGYAFAASFRFGVQLRDNLAVYYQGGAILGLLGTDAVVFFSNAALGEWHPTSSFSLAFGPSLDRTRGTVCAPGSGGRCVGGDGFAFGVQARMSLAFAFAARMPDAPRSCVRISLTSHSTIFRGDLFEFITLHGGYEWF